MTETVQEAAVYRERPGSDWFLWGPIVAWLLVCVWGVLDAGPATLIREGTWIIFPVLLLAFLPFSSVSFSKRAYHSITLDARMLRVGRQRIALADIDPRSAHQALAEADPSWAQRLVPSLNHLELPDQRAGRGAPTLMGGAWGLPAGMDSVVVADCGGQRHLIATLDRRAFLTALVQVLPAPA